MSYYPDRKVDRKISAATYYNVQQRKSMHIFQKVYFLKGFCDKSSQISYKAPLSLILSPKREKSQRVFCTGKPAEPTATV